ncbi:MAG: hypothetical protein ACRC9K_19000 [Afipia sp.]
MKKIVLAVATAATLAVTALAAPAPAEARGGRIAVGLGILGGAIAGAAIANSGGYYGPGYGYYGGPGYGYAPAYYGGGGCYLQRERFWDGYGWRVRRVQVCD